MSETEQLVYIKVKDGKKNYVESVSWANGTQIQNVIFTDEKAKAKSFEPTDAELIQKKLQEALGQGYTEPDESVTANA